MVLGGWVSSQLWLVSNKIVWLFGFLCLEFNGWVVWQGWTKRTNNNILRWSKLPWMQLLFRRDDSYSLHSSLWDILPLINFLKLRSHWQQTLRFFFVVRDLRWYLVSQPPTPEVALIFPGSSTQKRTATSVPVTCAMNILMWYEWSNQVGPTKNWGGQGRQADKR